MNEAILKEMSAVPETLGGPSGPGYPWVGCGGDKAGTPSYSTLGQGRLNALVITEPQPFCERGPIISSPSACLRSCPFPRQS